MREIIDIKQNGLKVYVRNHAQATFLSDGTTVESAIDLFNEKIDSQSSEISDKQNILVSGENIKTINGQSILGSGDIVIENEPVIHCTINKSTDTVQIQNITSKVGISGVSYTEDEPYTVPSYILLGMIIVCDLDYTYYIVGDGTILGKWPVYSRNKWSVLDYNFNGYEYVDLGLPSGTKWAKCNVGANSETDAGLYFAWGEVVGYTADDVTNKIKQFNEIDYKYGDPYNPTKYNKTDGLTMLLSEDDAASVNMGGDWHMPSEKLYEELLNSSYTTITWTTIDGIFGMRITSNINGNTLFFPASGYASDGSFGYVNYSGHYWDSSFFEDWYLTASNMMFLLDYHDIVGADRHTGRTVRGVIG